jgi:uncharacterized membrane protein (UPF0127 family)
MRKTAILAGAMLVLLHLNTACPYSASDPALSAASALTEAGAQPRLPTIKLRVGAHEMVAELARTSRQIASGMMHRAGMAPDEAMLFIYPSPRRVYFYMRNTLIPLSCAYIDGNGVIREIYAMKPGDETPIASRSDRIQFVLEVNQGWFEKNNIGPGSSVRTNRGALQDLMKGAD